MIRKYPAVGGIPTGAKFLRDDLTWATAATSGLTGTITFYASSTSGGATDQLNTVTLVNGVVTAWTQGGGGGGGGATTGGSLGLLLTLTQA